MKDNVLIKGNKSGLTIILNDTVSMPIIKKALYDKLLESKNFFGDSKVTLTFKGRELADDDYTDLIDIVNETTDLNIMCVIDESNQELKEIYSPVANEPPMINTSGAIFHKGTLRSGQELVVDSSIIIIGNVHTGAKVVSTGNVIVIGEVRGSIYAGENGNQKSFIVALKMNPLQLKIGDVIGRSASSRPRDLDKPKIAFVEDGHIFIEKINRNIYKDIDFLNYN